ncbi:MAG: NAD-dependent epimerase/dehydratase family protein [Candidatus Omnitrophica bacterium]|nr:NAD-dependent epimerase/dehydratase family protein [Candidatus Omnitrophota bacterium]
MNILVIGGSGFIGTAMIRELLTLGYSVRNFDKNPSVEFGKLSTIGDVRDQDALNKGLKDIDVVFNLAAEHRDDVTPVSLYYDVNVQGAKNIVQAAELNNVEKIIFTSTVAVYGLNKPDATEESPTEPFNDYSKSKLEAEEVFSQWAGRGDCRCLIIVRPVVIFGEGNQGNVYNLIRQIQGNKFMMVGDGRNRKSMGYVGNLVQFIIKTMEFAPGIHLFNYADKPDLTVKELLDCIREELSLNNKPLARLPYSIGLLGGYAFDLLSKFTGKKYPINSIRIKKFCANTTVSTKALEIINFTPPFSLREGLRRMTEKIQSQKFSEENPR